MAKKPATRKNPHLKCHTKSDDGRNVLTAKGIATYAFVFRARKNKNADDDAKAAYSMTLLIPKKYNIDALDDAVDAAAKEKWGSGADKKLKKARYPAIVDGDDMAEELDNDLYADHWVIRAKNYDKPTVVDRHREVIEDETEFYSGCIARMTVRASAYDHKGNVGVSWWLQNVQKIDDGERLSGKSSAEEDFDDDVDGED